MEKDKILIGKKLKELREQRKLSLTDLARESGVQLATLSRIENNRMTGTIESHAKIAYVLGIELEDLYKDIKTEKAGIKVFRLENTPHNDKASYQILTNHPSPRKMTPTLITIEPNGKTKEVQPEIGSERFAFVLAGEVEAIVKGESFPLAKNNSIYIGPLPYSFRNSGKTKAEIVLVSTPSEL